MVQLQSREWWWNYLEVIIMPREIFSVLRNASVHTYDFLSPFLLVVAMSFILTLCIFSNKAIVERFLTADMEYYQNDQERDNAVAVQQAVETGFDQPSINVLTAASLTRDSAISTSVFLIVCLVTVSALTQKWRLHRSFFVITSISTSVLLFGGLFNWATRVFWGRLSPLLSVGFFIRPFDYTKFGNNIANGADLFTLWYIVLISYGISILYGKRFGYSVIITTSNWFLLSSLSYFIHFNFGFGV